MSEIRATCAAPVAIGAEGPPDRIMLLRMGRNPTRDKSKAYVLADRAHGEAVIAASRAYHGSTDPMIDYDHQSVFGAKDGVGGNAPAAGWMKDLQVDDQGLWAKVEWTGTASAELTDKRYRYISPYFGHTADGRVTRIFNAALTNRPELELRAVASAADPSTSTEDMTLDKDLLIALGLAEGATAADAIAAATSMKTELAGVCSALGLTAGANAAAIAVKIGEMKTAASQAGKVDPAAFVPRAEFDRVAAQVTIIAEDRVAASVNAAIQAGKLAPASKDWALDYAKANPEGFTKFIGTAVSIVQPGAEETRAAAVKDGTLTAEERATCTAMGVAEADFLASRKEMGQ